MNKQELIEKTLRESKDFAKEIRKYFFEINKKRELTEQESKLYEEAHKIHIKTNDSILIIAENTILN